MYNVHLFVNNVSARCQAASPRLTSSLLFYVLFVCMYVCVFAYKSKTNHDSCI